MEQVDEQSSNQPMFEIRPVIEQKPFENPAVQFFFSKWCEINDSIEPQYVDRKTREERGVKGILERNIDGKQTLYIPHDLALWEMVGIMETVDHDTYAQKPEKKDTAKEKILILGKEFQNAGIYIAKRLNFITNGREIAHGLAEEFYGYGQSLIERKSPEQFASVDEISKKELTPSETDEIDRFLAGDRLYKARKASVERKAAIDPKSMEELVEQERCDTLAQFFRVSEKAFLLSENPQTGELQSRKPPVKPWLINAPIHSGFLRKVEQSLKNTIETPKRELVSAVFLRGLEKVVTDTREAGWKYAVNTLFEKAGIDLHLEQRKLTEVLRLPELKAELEALRQTGDIERISAKEREIADKIQDAVSRFPREENSQNPSEIVATQNINCVGASILGGSLLKEAGIVYLVGNLPRHSLLFVLTSDEQVLWRDMLFRGNNRYVTDPMIQGTNMDGNPLTVKDIIHFSNHPTTEGLMFEVVRGPFDLRFPWIPRNHKVLLTLFESEMGQKIQLLKNTALTLSDLGRIKEANEANRLAASFNPRDPDIFNNFGNSLLTLEHDNDALAAYRKAISIDPDTDNTYNALGYVLSTQGKFDEAIQCYREAIKNNPNIDYFYNNLGNALVHENKVAEAIDAYTRYVRAADPSENSKEIQKVKAKIQQLKQAI